MTLRVSLAEKRYMTVLTVYASTLTSDQDSKDHFYDTLCATVRSVSRHDKITLLGDFNARVGSNHHVWKEVIGRYGLGNANSNGFRLLNLCSEFDQRS